LKEEPAAAAACPDAKAAKMESTRIASFAHDDRAKALRTSRQPGVGIDTKLAGFIARWGNWNSDHTSSRILCK
jgi:hypothetical protein